MEAEKRVLFKLESIQEEKFSKSDASVSKEVLRVQYLVETEVHPANDNIVVRSGVRYLVEESIVCEMVLAIKFSIAEFHSVVSIDTASKKISFTSNIIPTFLGITYGALRGALFERVKDTTWESYPLPPMSATELEKINHFRVINSAVD